MLTDELFYTLVEAAGMAPSSDNLQPWEFGKRNDNIDVFCIKSRLLRIDVMDMFSWISIGAAIQNIVIKAAENGFLAEVEYPEYRTDDNPAAVIRISSSTRDGHLACWIPRRTTNRSPYNPFPLNECTINKLTKSVKEFTTGIHRVTSADSLAMMAMIDMEFSSVLLAHKPFFDGLFDTLRFSKKEIEKKRYGMDIKSLDMPYIFAFIARNLKGLKINRIISRLGIGRIMVKLLSSRLKKCGSLFLISISDRNQNGFMEAGQAMEQLWLAASALGLSVQPYGVIPQYLTMAEKNPDAFIPEHLKIIRRYQNQFMSIFPQTGKEYPVIMLRIGETDKQSIRTTVRFRSDQIIRITDIYSNSLWGDAFEK